MAKCECEEGLAEWVMSYADMITILMAFFVVMYSMAGNKDTVKEEAVMKSLRERFGPSWWTMSSMSSGAYVPSSSPFARVSGAPGSKQDKRTKGKYDPRTRMGDHPRVHTLKPGEQAAIGGILYFDDLESQVTPQHQKQIQIAADEIGGKPQRIEIRGHTARRPVPVGSEGDKWDLAYRRCRNTMQRLVALGIDPRRIRLGVAADNEPLVDGDEPLPRSRSSRVEIFMLDEVVEGSALEPRKAEDSKAAQN